MSAISIYYILNKIIKKLTRAKFLAMLKSYFSISIYKMVYYIRYQATLKRRP